MRHVVAVGLLMAALVVGDRAMAADPAETISQSEQVLAELVAIPGKQIPAKLLAEAQAIAVIPRVIKIGFVAGGRRGHGVVLVRDAEGAWSQPRFVKLTGGSVGWQAGVSGTDVVLVFRTRRSVEGLLKGRFTVGVDAAAAAGPVGRNAAAATDTSLQAEILSYSRSRGLFLGASIDGSAIELDEGANASFYGSPNLETPQVIPPAASQLQAYVMELTGGAPGMVAAPGTAAGAPPAATAIPPAVISPVRAEALRRSLLAQSAQLTPLLNPEWQAYLGMPANMVEAAAPMDFAALAETTARYEQVASAPQYRELAARPEFQGTLELLREYVAATRVAAPALQLPPPPAGDRR
jgi:lipid-binding SYLF domain-containing protein